MITLSASGGSVTFEFSGNSTYLNDGQITVPVNSLALIIDESDMATFRKAASNDIFVSANIAEFGMTKAELESWYKANMVGSTGGVTSGEVQTMIDKSISGKVDTEDLDISGKTLYVGDYHSGGMPYELTKEYPISTKPTKLLVKRTDDGDATNVTAFQLYFDNGTTSGSCILRVSTAVGSGITEAAWQVETPEASLELVNGEVYITFLNGYYLTMFKPASYIQGFVMQIVTDVESGSTPSVVESGIYDALNKMSETLTDVITKSDAAYYRGIGYPSLSYSSLSGITFSSSAVGVGVGINTATTSTLATDASIDANNGVLGVYTTGATHTVIKNDSDIIDRISINSIPSNIKMYWNSSYTGNTSHYIAVNCTVNDGTNGYCRWDWNNGQYVPNVNYVNTAVTLSYDSTNQVVTITPSSSSALTSIIYVRCNRNIAPSSALTQDNCKIGLVTIDSNSYKLQEALDNKQDILSAGRGISITTGDTADTVSFNLPISASTGENSIAEGYQTSATSIYSHAEGYQTLSSSWASHAEGSGSIASGDSSHAEGQLTVASGSHSHAEGDQTIASGSSSHAEGSATVASEDYSHAEGGSTSATSLFSHAEGYSTIAKNRVEHASGQYNVSNKAHYAFGNSGNTLFSVGNGTANNARHNAFEIRQNGDIYLTKDGQDIKLQDQLGGGGGEVSSAITSGDTNAVAGGAVYDAVVYSGSTYNTELTFDANGYAENWIVGQSAITIDVSGYTSDTRAIYHFENSNGLDLGYAHIHKVIGPWGSTWSNNADNCTITTDGDTATTATITDIPSGTVKVRRTDESNPPKAIISGVTPEAWIKDALDDHRDNTTVHITAAERSTWNNKSNFSGSYNDLTDKPTPDSALTSYSTNAVQSKALFDELRISGEGEAETTLAFEGYYTTNYPNGCTKIKVEDISSMSSNIINFEDGEGHNIGNINVNNWGNISVDTSGLQGASYEISGTTVIISYPSVTTVTRLRVTESTKYTYKAITSSTTPLKNQVVANTTALGGLSLIKLTESEYAALVTKDPNVLYVVIPDPS